MGNKEYILNKILETEISNDPWKHLVVKDFLPKSLYDGIKEETSVYVNREEMRGTENKGARAYHVNINKSIGVYPLKNQPHLKEYYDILNDIEIENAIKDKVFLEDYHKMTDSVDMWGSFDIMTSGFTYDEVHPDHEAKMITMIHYLADNDEDKEIGTLLYSPKIEGSKQSIKNDIVSRTFYIPNCVLFFAPCKKPGYITNHSMMHHSKKTAFRKTIQTFWLRQKSDWTTKAQKGRIKL